METNRVQVTFTGERGKVDGYYEMWLGIMALSGVLKSHTVRTIKRQNNQISIKVTAELTQPLLGHLGENDLN